MAIYKPYGANHRLVVIFYPLQRERRWIEIALPWMPIGDFSLEKQGRVGKEHQLSGQVVNIVQSPDDESPMLEKLSSSKTNKY